MRFKITNKGPARTVDFLGVFSEGETREFTQGDMDNYQNLSGVPVFSSVLTDEAQFDLEVIGEGEES